MTGTQFIFFLSRPERFSLYAICALYVAQVPGRQGDLCLLCSGPGCTDYLASCCIQGHSYIEQSGIQQKKLTNQILNNLKLEYLDQLQFTPFNFFSLTSWNSLKNLNRNRVIQYYQCRLCLRQD